MAIMINVTNNFVNNHRNAAWRISLPCQACQQITPASNELIRDKKIDRVFIALPPIGFVPGN